METSMARLSSGKRINSAADDAAGIQIATRMDTEIRGLNLAVRNAADASSFTDNGRCFRWFTLYYLGLKIFYRLPTVHILFKIE